MQLVFSGADVLTTTSKYGTDNATPLSLAKAANKTLQMVTTCSYMYMYMNVLDKDSCVVLYLSNECTIRYYDCRMYMCTRLCSHVLVDVLWDLLPENKFVCWLKNMC